MCGIVALMGSRPDSLRRGQAAAMTTCICHRGPDGEGVWEDEESGVVLGHRRLAVVELSPLGAQPMVSRSGRYVLSFNGEFYNFRDVRARLQSSGCTFRGGSDTEVALAAFEAWGIEEGLRSLAGMFALTVWDREEKTLTLARDRIGEKPLYYGIVGNVLAAASELKAMTALPEWTGEIDRDVLAMYLRGNYVPGPFSIFRGVAKLPPGTLLRVRREDILARQLPQPVAYWSLADVAMAGVADPFTGSDDEAADALQACLETVIGEQMLADVPIGSFLSGGIDSSTVTALMQAQSARPVRTFTIGFDDPAFDESAHAREIARHLGTEHTEVRVGAREALDVVPLLPTIYDEPFADSSQISTTIVARLARRHSTVCLTGDGGDETFCGYNRQVWLQRISRRLLPVPRPLRSAVGSLLESFPTSLYDALLRGSGRRIMGDQVQKLAAILKEEDIERMYVRLASFWPDPTLLVPGSEPVRTLLLDRSRWPALPDPLQRLLWVESVTSLPDDMLVKVDRAAMSVALETRTPLVDHRVVELAWRFPLHLKLRDGTGKWILRRVLDRFVPRALVDRPKAGFGVPVDQWLRGPLRGWAEDLLDPTRLRDEGYFDVSQVRRCWDEHLSGRRKWNQQLWGILMFQAWKQHWASPPAVTERPVLEPLSGRSA